MPCLQPGRSPPVPAEESGVCRVHQQHGCNAQDDCQRHAKDVQLVCNSSNQMISDGYMHTDGIPIAHACMHACMHACNIRYRSLTICFTDWRGQLCKRVIERCMYPACTVLYSVQGCIALATCTAVLPLRQDLHGKHLKGRRRSSLRARMTMTAMRTPNSRKTFHHQ